jgi:hypothetical protein
MSLKFSQRIGKTAIDIPIQIDCIDESLRNCLWSCLYKEFLHHFISAYINGTMSSTYWTRYEIWVNYFKNRMDEMPNDFVDAVKKYFFKCEWYEVYEFLEFLVTTDLHCNFFNAADFTRECNLILERESSGYRFINQVIGPITNQIEINTITEALENTLELTMLKGANIHLNLALEKLSDKENPDFRNSIKESISAVESVVFILSRQNKSFATSIRVVGKDLGLHRALQGGLIQIYGYTSDEHGIRHALKHQSNSDVNDAKFMLVSCSASVNYLISKAVKHGLNLRGDAFVG